MKDTTMPEDQTPTSENFPKTQDDLDRIIQSALAPKIQKLQSLEAEKTQLSTERDSLTATVTQRDQEISGLRDTVQDRDRSLLVSSVAHSKGVPAKWLHGDTQDDLEASAEEFLSDARSLTGSTTEPAGAPDQGTGNNESSEGQSGGYVRSSGTGSEDSPRPSYEDKRQRAYERAKKQKEGGL